MNDRPRSGQLVSWAPGWLAAACGLLLLAGCQSGPDGSKGWTLKNPFKSKDSDSENQVARSDAGAAKEAKESKERKQEKTKDDGSPDFTQEMSRARNLERSGKYGEARIAYERLITRFPERYEPYHRLAVVADRQKRFTEAQALYTQAIRMNPKNPDLFNDLGYCLFLQGQLDKAEAAMFKAIGLAPSNPRYRNNLGMVYGHQGRYDEALAQFRRGGSEADAYYNLAFVLAARDDVEGAKNCFRMALRADPTYDQARRALQSFTRAAQDPQGAMDSSPVVENGIRWVPYVEGNESAKDYDAQPASHTTTSAGRVVPSTRPETQADLRRAREGLADRLRQGRTE